MGFSTVCRLVPVPDARTLSHPLSGNIMGKIRFPEAALLFIGALYSDPEVFFQSNKILEKTFGDSLLVTPPLPWDYSAYYRDELGSPIKRQFIFINNLFDTGTLADIKIITNEIETSFSLNGKRRINLDPGYITLAKIVLASTKNYSHRINLGKGIYGEITLLYIEKEGTFKKHLFTYRDYQEKSCIDMFLNARGILKKMLTT
jgi:hypothetical protein